MLLYNIFLFNMSIDIHAVSLIEMFAERHNGLWPDGLTPFSIRRLKGHSIGALLKQLQPDGDLGGHPATDHSPKESSHGVQNILQEGKDR